MHDISPVMSLQRQARNVRRGQTHAAGVDLLSLQIRVPLDALRNAEGTRDFPTVCSSWLTKPY